MEKKKDVKIISKRAVGLKEALVVFSGEQVMKIKKLTAREIGSLQKWKKIYGHRNISPHF